MEAIIASVIEKSVITGAFLYILHYLITKQATTLEAISDTQAKISMTLIEVCHNMESMDKRIQKLEERGGV